LKIIDIVLGTRPEIIKLWSVIEEFEECGKNFRLIHTGQHYSETLDNIFFEDLHIEEPDVNLDIGSSDELIQISEGLDKLYGFWKDKGKPNLVVVQGDTNSTFIGALAARKKGIDVAHVEAGLRSGNEEMSEEMNRKMIDHISQYLFPPTNSNLDNLTEENISESKIFETGNTVVDAIQFVKKKVEAGEVSNIASRRDIEDYVVLTCHRQETVDEEERFREIMETLIEGINDTVIYPMHPRVKAQISDEFIQKLEKEFVVTEPLGYIEFIALLSSAKACITDSGGLQEETPALDVPCFTIRSETEREESIEAGANILLGTEGELIRQKLKQHYNSSKLLEMANANNPYGDGSAGSKIVKKICGECK
jgi:UDP-N-acetylglucosamine 2-epimerase (non-hydrolysing)